MNILQDIGNTLFTWLGHQSQTRNAIACYSTVQQSKAYLLHVLVLSGPGDPVGQFIMWYQRNYCAGMISLLLQDWDDGTAMALTLGKLPSCPRSCLSTSRSGSPCAS